MRNVYVVCVTGYEECLPVAAFTDEASALTEVERIKAFRDSRSGDGAGMYTLPLDSEDPVGFWMSWLNADGSWDEDCWMPYSDMDHDCIRMIGDGPAQWRGKGWTLAQSRAKALEAKERYP